MFFLNKQINTLQLLLTFLVIFTNVSLSRWEKITPVPGCYVLDITSNEKYLFLCTYNGFYRSFDKGKNWELVNKSFIEQTSPLIYLKKISILAKVSNVYIVTPQYIYFSSDNGESWSEIGPKILPGSVPDRPIILHNGYLFTSGYRSSKNGENGRNFRHIKHTRFYPLKEICIWELPRLVY